MDEQAGGEQKPKKRGRPSKYGVAMPGAMRQRESMERKYEAQVGVRFILNAAIKAIQKCPEAHEEFLQQFHYRYEREWAEKGLPLLSEELQQDIRRLLAI